MRKINPSDFTMATRGTSREINRQIALTLIRDNQPISRADLARFMNTNRANVTFLVNELLEENLVREEGQGTEKVRGRKPTYLYLNSKEKFAVAIDVRVSGTFMMVTDSIGSQIGGVINFPTEHDPKKFVSSLGKMVRRNLQKADLNLADCEGIGIVIPGMLDRKTGTVLRAPTLRWHDVNLLAPLEKEFSGVEIHLENSGKACALSQVWSAQGNVAAFNDLVFVSVSDGLGIGVIVNGEVMRGKNNTAGEFGHVPLSIDGPRCSCGANGCWEAYVANPATMARYFGGRSFFQQTENSEEKAKFTIENLIGLARSGDVKALTALHSTARYLGLGLASIINAINPSCVYIGGEITEVWNLIDAEVREAIKERTLTTELGATPVRIVPATDYPRLRGAVALVTAPAFAAPKVA